VELTEEELRLCGDVAGKRLLDLGCARGESCVTFASRGAKVIGIDQSADDLAYARRLAEEEDLRVELRHGDLADLAFLPPASVDVAFSGGALSYVIDTGRVFRQVHRVLKTGAPFVFSVVHPAARLGTSPYWSGYTIADLFGGLQRANFDVDHLLEPEPARTTPPTVAPQTLIMRGRKLGL
jgi:cyclopropane fatty-acyl-phospholipid synthase-like methyltransferase